MGEKTYKESSVLVELGTRKPILIEDFRSPEEYWQDEAHDKDKEIDRLTAQLDASRALLAERDAETRELQVIKAVHRALINNTNVAEDKRIEKIVQLTTENATLREEVERLKAPLMDAPAAYENGRKQTAQEIVQYIANLPNKSINQSGLILTLKTIHGLEG